MQPSHLSGRSRALSMLALVIAGEAVFFLPFVIARVFRPTLLQVLGLSNWQLGVAFSFYGVVAMLAYFPGGPLADRFSPRALMATALAATSIGGLGLAAMPSLGTLKLLYGFWGLTSILLFWAALIRATRDWGGDKFQGRAFGLLDGGRGLVAAGIGSIAVVLFDWVLPDETRTITAAERVAAFRWVILMFTGITLAVSGLVWIALPPPSGKANDGPEEVRDGNHRVTLHGVLRVLSLPTVWLQAIIIICAYVAYKGLDDVSLYARDALNFNEIEAARASTASMWMRPFAAIAAGFLADRVGAGLMTAISFLGITAGGLVIASGALQPGMMAAFWLTLLTTSAAVFALRGLYFAIMDEGHVPMRYTGSAVGFVSAIGYTPDVFMGPLMGWLLDRSPGAPGHQHLFAAIAVFAVAGLIATAAFHRVSNKMTR